MPLPSQTKNTKSEVAETKVASSTDSSVAAALAVLAKVSTIKKGLLGRVMRSQVLKLMEELVRAKRHSGHAVLTFTMGNPGSKQVHASLRLKMSAVDSFVAVAPSDLNQLLDRLCGKLNNSSIEAKLLDVMEKGEVEISLQPQASNRSHKLVLENVSIYLI